MNLKKANRCKHKWSPNYHDGGSCETPYCQWGESHCLKCGVYEITCLCGFCSGMSGEPRKRAERRNRKDLAHIDKLRDGDQR
jgi:hypothetical protein